MRQFLRNWSIQEDPRDGSKVLFARFISRGSHPSEVGWAYVWHDAGELRAELGRKGRRNQVVFKKSAGSLKDVLAGVNGTRNGRHWDFKSVAKTSPIPTLAEVEMILMGTDIEEIEPPDFPLSRTVDGL